MPTSDPEAVGGQLQKPPVSHRAKHLWELLHTIGGNEEAWRLIQITLDREREDVRDEGVRLVSDHHLKDRDRPPRDSRAIRNHIHSDHPCCIPVGDAVAILHELAQVSDEAARGVLYGVTTTAKLQRERRERIATQALAALLGETQALMFMNPKVEERPGLAGKICSTAVAYADALIAELDK